MRNSLSDILRQNLISPESIFLTGDLGFMALEELKEVMGGRFINAGISEQNMISVAAALAQDKLDVWVYSIAPFIYARAYEQIRNDICFHGLSVKLVGNGGGYAYGVMGPTHHAIEDYGILLALPSMRIFAPIFNSDIAPVVNKMKLYEGPSYLRLGKSEMSSWGGGYDPWRELVSGGDVIVIAIGAIAGLYIAAFSKLPEGQRPTLWGVSELPLEKSPPPERLINQIKKASKIIVVEEHVEHGGLASQIALYLMINKICVSSFIGMTARKHCYENYGSQDYLRKKSRLDVESVMKMVRNI